MKRTIVEVDANKCTGCDFCIYTTKCYSPDACIGCLACYFACPYQARKVECLSIDVENVKIYVDNVEYMVPSGISVKEALKLVGFKFAPPGSKGVSTSCNTGGCWSCALIINGKLERTCITPVRDNMRIETNIENVEPLRIVHGPEPHMVGGKATPWWQINYVDYVEAAIWVAGCNLRCPQCQNYHVTYDNTTKPLTPREAAEMIVLMIVLCHKTYNTKGVAISGGEPTLNRRWLIEFFKEVRRMVNDKVRRHLDSNGTLLTPDYIDEIVEAGCNNIGVEPKCINVGTYMKITGIQDRDIALKYLETAWKAIEYINEKYLDNVYLGVGLVYNKELISLDEIAEACLLYTSPSPRDLSTSRMPSSA